MAEGRIPGIPSNLRILLLGQTRIESNDLDTQDGNAEESSTTTVLQHVLRSDARRERALKEVHGMVSELSGKKMIANDTSSLNCLGQGR
jgi:hypothetical protein